MKPAYNSNLEQHTSTEYSQVGDDDITNNKAVSKNIRMVSTNNAHTLEISNKTIPLNISKIVHKQPSLKKFIEKQQSTINRLENRKKYGLVWEESKTKEEIAKDGRLPILSEISKNKIKTSEDQYNIIIEGDNLHALSILNYTHKGMIDIIYIDPPYNTGAQNWIYNNDYVDNADKFKHSKWLSMMSIRLRLAQKLLVEKGVLICTIDENELAHLGCLLDEIFPDYEKHLITIVHNPRGAQGNNFSYQNEYAFFVFKNGLKIIGEKKLPESKTSNFRNWGGESLRSDAKNCFYPVIVKNNKVVGFGDVTPNDVHPDKIIKSGKSKNYYPIDKNGIERKWRYSRQSVDEIKKQLIVKGDEILIEKTTGKTTTVWHDPKYDASVHGTQLLRQILGKSSFNYPKSLYAVRDCIQIIKSKKNPIILDFFAGSGTTGHAVLHMNNDDNGNRKFILCTNNENNICSDVTYPRISSVIKGYKHKDQRVDGLGGGLIYYKIEQVDKEPGSEKTSPPAITDANKRRILTKISGVLCLKDWCFDLVHKDKSSIPKFAIYTDNDNNFMGIIFDNTSTRDFIKTVNKRQIQKIHTYVFSSIESTAIRKNRNKIKFESVPLEILQVWKRIFESNMRNVGGI